MLLNLTSKAALLTSFSSYGEIACYQAGVDPVVQYVPLSPPALQPSIYKGIAKSSTTESLSSPPTAKKFDLPCT